MDRLRTSTVLKCSGCAGSIGMFEECWKDGIDYYHNQCRPFKTIENKQGFKTADEREPDGESE